LTERINIGLLCEKGYVPAKPQQLFSFPFFSYNICYIAKNVLHYLSDAQKSADVSRRIPFMFITNGGGVLEREKAHEISDVFFPGLPVPVR
jgi:hypothetical protein